jgi:prepilin-type N-terminal cleavage/methylation domain-containing protein
LLYFRYKVMHVSSRKGFTLIELLVVIAIIAILAVVVVLTLNPAELLRQSRDSNRVSDMATLTNALNLYNTDQGGSQSYSLGSASTAYISIPDPTATSTAGDQCQGLGMPSVPSGTYHCAPGSFYRNVDGTGWIPVNFSAITSGSPLGSLPVDPTNQTSSNLFYTYQTNGTQFETTAVMESQKYQSLATTDGGPYTNLYVKGSNLSLALTDYDVGSENDGSTAVPSAYEYKAGNRMFFKRFTTASGGVLQSCSVNMGSVTTYYPNHMKCALYTDSSGVPGSLIANTQSAQIVPVAGWNTFSVTGGTTLSPATSYWLAYWADTFSDNFPGVESSGSYRNYEETVTYGSWPTTASGASAWDYMNGAYITLQTTGIPNTWYAPINGSSQQYWPIPAKVWFNGNPGTEETSPSGLTGTNEWYSTGNTLYVYSTSTPSAFNYPQLCTESR